MGAYRRYLREEDWWIERSHSTLDWMGKVCQKCPERPILGAHCENSVDEYGHAKN